MADDPREPLDPQADAIAGRRVADLLEHIPATVFILTNEVPPRLLYVNGQVERLTGYSRQAWLEDPDLWMRSMHPADQERVMDRWAESVHAASSFLCEYRIVRPDGSVASVRETTDPVRNVEGDVVCWQGVTHDITDRQAAEEALTRSETRYRALVERLPAVVYVDSDEVDPRSLYVSPNSEEVLGYAPSRYLEDPGLWYATIHPDDLTMVQQAWAGVIESRGPFTLEYRMVRPDGGSLWVRDSSIPIMDEVGDTLFWQGVMLDITAQKLAEEDLRRSETRYRVLVEQVPATVYICTDEERPRTLFTSPHSHDQDEVAYGEDERATRWISTIHDDQREEVIGAWVEAVRTGSDFDHEYRRTHLGAEETTWVRDICRLVRDEAGQPMFRQGVILDITRAKKAEHDLRESERRYRALVEQVPAVVYEMGPDDERRTTFVSPHVEDILGYSRQEWLDQPDIWTELLHPDDREIELAAHDLHNETGEPWRREYRLIANDGRIVWVRDQAVLVEDPVTIDARWQGVMLDITAEKDREQSLQAANDDLEWRVLARTAELEDAAEMMSLEIGERRRVEAELREAETRYRMLVEDLPAVIYSWEMNWLDGAPLPEEIAAYTSPAITDMLGFTADEWMRPEFWRQRVHPHDRDRVDAEADRCIASGLPLNLEYRYLAKDGGRGVGLGPRDPADTRRAWPPPPVPGGPARHHRTQGGRDEGLRSRSVVQAAHRGEPRDHVGRVRPRSRSRRPVASLLRESSQPRAVRVSARSLLGTTRGMVRLPASRRQGSGGCRDGRHLANRRAVEQRFPVHPRRRTCDLVPRGRPRRRIRRGRPAHRLPGRHPGHRRPQARRGAPPSIGGTGPRGARRDACASVDRGHRPADGRLALRVHGRAEQ